MKNLMKRIVKDAVAASLDTLDNEIIPSYRKWSKEREYKKLVHVYESPDANYAVNNFMVPYLKREGALRNLKINDYTVTNIIWSLACSENAKRWSDEEIKEIINYTKPMPFVENDYIFRELCSRSERYSFSREDQVELVIRKKDYIDKIFSYYEAIPNLRILFQNDLIPKPEIYSIITNAFDGETIEEFQKIFGHYLYVILSEAGLNAEDYINQDLPKNVVYSLKKRKEVYEDYDTMNYSIDDINPIVFSRIAPLYPYRYLCASSDERTRSRLLKSTPRLESHFNGMNTDYFYNIEEELKRKYSQEAVNKVFLRALDLEEPLTLKQWRTFIDRSEEFIDLPSSWWSALV